MPDLELAARALHLSLGVGVLGVVWHLWARSRRDNASTRIRQLRVELGELVLRRELRPSSELYRSAKRDLLISEWIAARSGFGTISMSVMGLRWNLVAPTLQNSDDVDPTVTRGTIASLGMIRQRASIHLGRLMILTSPIMLVRFIAFCAVLPIKAALHASSPPASSLPPPSDPVVKENISQRFWDATDECALQAGQRARTFASKLRIYDREIRDRSRVRAGRRELVEA